MYENMFTGLVTHVGTVASRKNRAITVRAPRGLLRSLKKGGSVSVSGICLTAIAAGRSAFTAHLMKETVKRTNVQTLAKGSLVNLELPARAISFLSGHLVQGHIDGTGRLQSVAKNDSNHMLTFSIPRSLSKYVVEKGSIAVNGVSLTVSEVAQSHFTVGVIPHTWAHTMLHTINVGGFINIEVDILAKYVKKLLENPSQNKPP